MSVFYSPIYLLQYLLSIQHNTLSTKCTWLSQCYLYYPVTFSVKPDSLSKSQKDQVEEFQRSDNQPVEDHDKQKGLHVPKWIKIVTFGLVILLGSAVAFCAVLAKTTFAAIASRMYANFSSHDLVGDENEKLRRDSVAFVQLILILCFPQVFTAIRTFFCGIAGKSSKQYPWPQPSSLVVVSSTLFIGPIHIKYIYFNIFHMIRN